MNSVQLVTSDIVKTSFRSGKLWSRNTETLRGTRTKKKGAGQESTQRGVQIHSDGAFLFFMRFMRFMTEEKKILLKRRGTEYSNRKKDTMLAH